ncbi:MAG: methyl-accepting chemotaxis protein [Pseudomonadales bacterium]|nr:methyl-accepting chemotaxis protein [Pseudomonadales bacterium]
MLKMPNFSFKAMGVGKRLLILTLITTLTLALIGSLSAVSLNYAHNASTNLHNQVRETALLSDLISTVQQDTIDTLYGVNTGLMTWQNAKDKLVEAQLKFHTTWNELLKIQKVTNFSPDKFSVIQNSVPGVLTTFEQFDVLSDSQSRAQLELFLLNDAHALLTPFTQGAKSYNQDLTAAAEADFSNSEEVLDQALAFGLVLIIASILGSITVAQLIRRSILTPVNQLSATVAKVKSGDTDARTELKGQDELHTLGQALDSLLNEKVATLVQIEKENDILNNSLIELLESTSKLSERDLTTKLIVREDITGPVADALNLVTKETSEALAKINQISQLVNNASIGVDDQTRKVITFAEHEREIISQTLIKLDGVSRHMAQIAKWCQNCNQIAQTTSQSTDKAYDAVGNTIESMNEIRDSISETEKRIKRLSERSLEISGIIDIINSIAERTHVLALNASMQAAAAGEAGRGFAVVADEVQRLAENSRNATSQISALVRNIQTETADAVDTMNTSISQVVNGSKRASQAGSQMKDTQSSTRELLNAVERIAQSSLTQAKETQNVRSQASTIEESTRRTESELQRQSLHTDQMRAAAGLLLDTVALFKIPDGIRVSITLPEPAPIASTSGATGRSDNSLNANPTVNSDNNGSHHNGLPNALVLDKVS